MIEIHDAEYFSLRETGERAAALRATNPVARKIHLDLAGHYAEKVAQASRYEMLRRSD